MRANALGRIAGFENLSVNTKLSERAGVRSIVLALGSEILDGPVWCGKTNVFEPKDHFQVLAPLANAPAQLFAAATGQYPLSQLDGIQCLEPLRLALKLDGFLEGLLRSLIRRCLAG